SSTRSACSRSSASRSAPTTPSRSARPPTLASLRADNPRQLTPERDCAIAVTGPWLDLAMGREADQALARLAQRQLVFTRDDALACGLSELECVYRISTRQWIAVFRGVYRLAGPDLDWRGLGAAACRAAAGPAAVSYRSALAIHDLPGGRRHVTEISTPRW